MDLPTVFLFLDAYIEMLLDGIFVGEDFLQSDVLLGVENELFELHAEFVFLVPWRKILRIE